MRKGKALQRGFAFTFHPSLNLLEKNEQLRFHETNKEDRLLNQVEVA
jgi:hypothetical protein